MKILILQDDFPPRAVGGAGAVAEQVALGYARYGHEVRVLTTVRTRDESGEYRHKNILVYAIYSQYAGEWMAYRSLYNPATVSKVKAYIEAYKPDVVHAHNIHQHISYHALKLAKKSGAKVILTAHDCMLFHYGKFVEYIDPRDLSIPSHVNYKISPWKQLAVYKKRYNPLRNSIIRHYLTYCDTMCAVSRALQEALAANGIPDAVVVYNGIDAVQWDTWQKSASDLRTLKELKQRPVIGFVGKLSGAKGGLQLLRALKEVQAHLPNVAVLVIGPEDSVTPSARALAEELGVASTLVITGRLSDAELVAAYKACTVVVFPSVCLDTFGMVNIEAMTAGKPVVATCFGGSPEVVEDGVTGTMVNPYNVRSLATALLEFLADPEKAERFGRAGRERARKEFALERQVEAYLSLMS